VLHQQGVQWSCIAGLQSGKDLKQEGITYCVTSKYTWRDYTALQFDYLILSVTKSPTVFKGACSNFRVKKKKEKTTFSHHTEGKDN